MFAFKPSVTHVALPAADSNSTVDTSQPLPFDDGHSPILMGTDPASGDTFFYAVANAIDYDHYNDSWQQDSYLNEMYAAKQSFGGTGSTIGNSTQNSDLLFGGFGPPSPSTWLVGPAPVEPTVPTDPGGGTPVEPIPTDPGGGLPVDPTPLPPPPPLSPVGDVSAIGDVTKFSPTDSEAAIASLNGPSITIGTQTIYIGTQQVSSINQNPIIASFDSSNPANNWVRTDYEMTGADGRGYGLFWSGQSLYGVFSVDGTQGTASEDFRRASSDATRGWLRSYGSGGGAKVSVVGRIDPVTGTLLDAAYLSAVLSSGKSNSLEVSNLSVNPQGNLVVSAQSYFAPRRPNGSAMTQVTSQGSPFNYTAVLLPDLSDVLSTAADGWT